MVCVPLLGTSLLTPSSIPNVSRLLAEVIDTLHGIQSSGHILTANLISYTFFPLSTILRRNHSSAIPDQVLEKILIILSILCESWWWDCDLTVWEQIFILCGAVIGGIEGKGKGKDRDDETKEAAVQCLFSLLRERTPDEESSHYLVPSDRLQTRLAEFQAHARTTKFIPVLGQTLNSLLMTAGSRHLSLQRLSLTLLHLLIGVYAPDYLIPSVLPGVVSNMCKVALGVSGSKGWANGEIVAGALKVMQEVVVKSIGDDICVKEGAIRSVEVLEDLVEWGNEPMPNPQHSASPQYSTIRTAAWLRGTSSQLHIAMNTLTPLVSHPTSSALLSLSKFSLAVLSTTPLTLPQTQGLLLSFLLSLSISTYPTVSMDARNSLLKLLTTSSTAQHSLMQTLMRNTRDNLAALPSLLPSHADAKVEHIAGLIDAVCRLATPEETLLKPRLSSISTGIGKLLGPTGGIEKWGWSLLSVLEFIDPPITVSRASVAQLMLESDPGASQYVPFPEATLKNVTSRSAQDALVRMFHSLGRAGGESCLFSVEWFTNVGRNGSGSRAVAAIWCACRLLEGVADVSLASGVSGDSVKHHRSKRLEKLARGLAKNVAERWDEADEGENTSAPPDDEHEDEDVRLPIQHVKGMVSLHSTLKISHSSPVKQHNSTLQPMLHKSHTLQLLAITAGILQARFTPLLIYTLYPVLHSLVSPVFHLSCTALATLNFITTSTSYASPANLLLSNFDYALDAVSRRLTRRWLDVDATKVLVVLVRLVGSDVVERAGDVVEECFDRLDEFHGYQIIVEGLVEVLGEVIKVIEADEEATGVGGVQPAPSSTQPHDNDRLYGFFEWFARRHDPPREEADKTDYGPAPREAWGEAKAKGAATEKTEEENAAAQVPDPNTDPPTATQALTRQIVSRSLYFLTHGSPVIRARILTLLSSSVPVLPESALLPSIHSAWPFILNRLADSETFVVSAAASLVEALATHVGSFMFRRIWDDVWPRFRTILAKLDAADAKNALAKRGYGAVGTESAYTHSHRLYRSLLITMTAAMKGVQPQDSSVWQVILAFRRFLHNKAHEDLQGYARDLYIAIGMNNADAVWLALSSTSGQIHTAMSFLRESRWEIDTNVAIIFQDLNL